MVEEDAVGGEHVIGLPVNLDCPEAGQFGDPVGAAGTERGALVLRDGVRFAEELGCTGEVELSAGGGIPDRVDHVERAAYVDVVGRGGVREAVRHEGLGGEVVKLVRLDLRYRPVHEGRVSHVTLQQPYLFSELLGEQLKRAQVPRGIPPDHPVNLVSLGEE